MTNKKMKLLWKFLCDNKVPNIVEFKGKNVSRIELTDKTNSLYLDKMSEGLRMIGL